MFLLIPEPGKRVKRHGQEFFPLAGSTGFGPDRDIVIDPIADVRVQWPFDEQSEAQILEKCRLHDHLLLLDVLDQRLIKPASTNPDDQPGSAFLLAIRLNDTLPHRFRRDDVAFAMAIGRAECLPQRVLLKTVHESWRKLG